MHYETCTWDSDAGTGGPGGGPLAPQYMADLSTLFQPGRADYPHLLLLAPQCFSPSGITALHLKQTFPPIIWIFIEGEDDRIESRLPFKIFSKYFTQQIFWY